MPGPKMGPRPADFDEQVIRQSPTFAKWNQLETGQKLRYACRDFVKGHGDDEERLMRRIMIARRNNIRDHQTLKRAREITHPPSEEDATRSSPNKAVKVEQQQQAPQKIAQTETKEEQAPPAALASPEVKVATPPKNNSATSSWNTRKRRPCTMFTDTEVAKEMDVAAVEGTRSYRRWLALKDGEEFHYNQKYIKGCEGHDWLVRKNIWRRMRYRRENKMMVERLRYRAVPANHYDDRNHGTPTSRTCDSSATNIHTNDSTATSPQQSSMLAPAQAVVSVLPSSSSGEDACQTIETNNHDSNDSNDEYSVNAAVEAAVAVAAKYVKSPYNMVHNPLDTAANSAALDAAARLAAAATCAMNNTTKEAVRAATEAASAPQTYQQQPEEQSSPTGELSLGTAQSHGDHGMAQI